MRSLFLDNFSRAYEMFLFSSVFLFYISLFFFGELSMCFAFIDRIVGCSLARSGPFRKNYRESWRRGHVSPRRTWQDFIRWDARSRLHPCGCLPGTVAWIFSRVVIKQPFYPLKRFNLVLIYQTSDSVSLMLLLTATLSSEGELSGTR